MKKTILIFVNELVQSNVSTPFCATENDFVTVLVVSGFSTISIASMTS